MEHVAVLRLEVADATIPWPARGSAEKVLCDRPGWEPRTIPTVDAGRASSMLAMCRGQLAVNLMLGGDDGFAICLSATGYRLSYGGRVFARCVDAMAAAEAMLEAASDWDTVPASGFGYRHVDVMRRVFDTAERRGEILLDRVYPT